MNLHDFHNDALAQKLLAAIHVEAQALPEIRIMEVCGTHTMAIGKMGLRAILPKNVILISGPGCPVCVTPGSYIDSAAGLALEKGVHLVTFGDMIRVPGMKTSLEKARGQGAQIHIATTPLQALEIAQSQKNEVVFLAVGFETTAPTTAGAILAAKKKGLTNVSFFTSHRLIPEALRVLVQDTEVKISGFMLPGHVSTILGEKSYRILEKSEIPSVITGFEPVDILAGILYLIQKIRKKDYTIHNAYRRLVPPEGNPKALQAMEEVFSVVPALWRGIGVIPGTGLAIREKYATYDAAKRYSLTVEPTEMPQGCSCGDVLRGRIPPNACPLFGKACIPDHPIGPCMVSFEGSCSAYYKYGM